MFFCIIYHQVLRTPTSVFFAHWISKDFKLDTLKDLLQKTMKVVMFLANRLTLRWKSCCDLKDTLWCTVTWSITGLMEGKRLSLVAWNWPAAYSCSAVSLSVSAWSLLDLLAISWYVATLTSPTSSAAPSWPIWTSPYNSSLAWSLTISSEFPRDYSVQAR